MCPTIKLKLRSVQVCVSIRKHSMCIHNTEHVGIECTDTQIPYFISLIWLGYLTSKASRIHWMLTQILAGILDSEPYQVDGDSSNNIIIW
jgi:hypothetical protein